METVISILSDILKGIVVNPDSVELHHSLESDEKGELYVVNVKVHRDDVGLCIGSGGNNAEAIRKVIGLVGWKSLQKRVYVRIDAPKIPSRHFDYPTTS